MERSREDGAPAERGGARLGAGQAATGSHGTTTGVAFGPPRSGFVLLGGKRTTLLTIAAGWGRRPRIRFAGVPGPAASVTRGEDYRSAGTFPRAATSVTIVGTGTSDILECASTGRSRRRSRSDRPPTGAGTTGEVTMVPSGGRASERPRRGGGGSTSWESS